jgi:hypothetical protein
MSQSNNGAVYENISKICGIAVPILYGLAGLCGLAIIALTYVVFFGSGDLEIEGGATLVLDSLSMFSKVIFALILGVTMAFLIRFFGLLIKVAKRFKVGEVFSDETALYAHSAAFTLLILNLLSLLITAYGAIVTGDLRLNLLPDGIASIVFAYLFAWVLKIGSQLKTENDLTV